MAVYLTTPHTSSSNLHASSKQTINDVFHQGLHCFNVDFTSEHEEEVHVRVASAGHFCFMPSKLHASTAHYDMLAHYDISLQEIMHHS
jgi:hypothetical protein